MEYYIKIKGKKEELKTEGKFRDKNMMIDLLLRFIEKVKKGDFE